MYLPQQLAQQLPLLEDTVQTVSNEIKHSNIRVHAKHKEYFDKYKNLDEKALPFDEIQAMNLKIQEEEQANIYCLVVRQMTQEAVSHIAKSVPAYNIYGLFSGLRMTLGLYSNEYQLPHKFHFMVGILSAIYSKLYQAGNCEEFSWLLCLELYMKPNFTLPLTVLSIDLPSPDAKSRKQHSHVLVLANCPAEITDIDQLIKDPQEVYIVDAMNNICQRLADIDENNRKMFLLRQSHDDELIKPALTANIVWHFLPLIKKDLTPTVKLIADNLKEFNNFLMPHVFPDGFFNEVTIQLLQPLMFAFKDYPSYESVQAFLMMINQQKRQSKCKERIAVGDDIISQPIEYLPEEFHEPISTKHGNITYRDYYEALDNSQARQCWQHDITSINQAKQAKSTQLSRILTRLKEICTSENNHIEATMSVPVYTSIAVIAVAFVFYKMTNKILDINSDLTSSPIINTFRFRR